MKCCIFCKSTDAPFTTREHVLPESLGGGEWAILPNDLFCDLCQNKFGSEIEQQALNDYPFSFLRVFTCIPTKKGKAPWFESLEEGTIRASLHPDRFGYDPNPLFEKAINQGRKTQIRLLARPTKPSMICRFLLKMGLEVIAWDNAKDVFSSKFDAARNFALTGTKTDKWWYLQGEHIAEAKRYFTKGVTEKEWYENVKLEVVKLEKGHEIFHLKLLYLDMLVPLTKAIMPQFDDLREPEYRLYWV